MRTRFWSKRLAMASLEFDLAIIMGLLVVIYLASGWSFRKVASAHEKVERALDATSEPIAHRNGKFRVACMVLGILVTTLLFIVLVLFFKMRG